MAARRTEARPLSRHETALNENIAILLDLIDDHYDRTLVAAFLPTLLANARACERDRVYDTLAGRNGR